MLRYSQRTMVVTCFAAVAGLSLLFGSFLSTHPYFTPSESSALPEGWTDEFSYVSKEVALSSGTAVIKYIRYQGPATPSIVILGIEPLEVRSRGGVKLILNGVPVGTLQVESTEKLKVTVASCCSFALLRPDLGSDLGRNLIWIGSEGFVGRLRYFLELPKEGIPK